jgi:hypothetical protein
MSTKHITFFQKIIEEEKNDLIHYKCCQFMRIILIPNNEIVFEIGISTENNL